MVISPYHEPIGIDLARTLDAFDPEIRSVETARELLATGDPIARKYNIATSLAVSDFVDAMNHAALARP